MIDLFPMLLVAVGAFLAGGMNAMAGGGTFFSFPALLASGIPPITANATNTVALWPASISSAWAYRQELHKHKEWVVGLTVVAFIGGIVGGLLLLTTSNAAFAKMIPWLLLIATALFAFSKQVGHLIQQLKRTWGKPGKDYSPRGPGGLLFQLIVAIYGGFFGAGQGILTLAALSIQGVTNIQELNALKNWIAAVTYTVAALTFIFAGAISWHHTLVMLVTASMGGYAGASLAKRLPATWLRWIVILVGTSLTLIYFFKTYSS